MVAQLNIYICRPSDVEVYHQELLEVVFLLPKVCSTGETLHGELFPCGYIYIYILYRSCIYDKNNLIIYIR